MSSNDLLGSNLNSAVAYDSMVNNSFSDSGASVEGLVDLSQGSSDSVAEGSWGSGQVLARGSAMAQSDED